MTQKTDNAVGCFVVILGMLTLVTLALIPGICSIIDHNRQWNAEISEKDYEYFNQLTTEQKTVPALKNAMEDNKITFYESEKIKNELALMKQNKIKNELKQSLTNQEFEIELQ